MVLFLLFALAEEVGEVPKRKRRIRLELTKSELRRLGRLGTNKTRIGSDFDIFKNF